MAAEDGESAFEATSPSFNASTPLAGPSSIPSSTASLPLQAPADVLTPDQISFLFFTGNQFEEHAAAAASQIDQPTTSSGKKRGRKLAPATGDKRREANRAAQRSFRERKVQHVRDLEIRAAAFEIQQARATQTIHSLLQDNARLRQAAGERPQTVSELVDLGSHVDPGLASRSSLAVSTSLNSVTSPNRSPGSLADSLSEPTSPATDVSGLPPPQPPNGLQHPYPPPAPVTMENASSTTYSMSALPLQPEFYPMGSACRPPVLPGLQSHMPAPSIGNYSQHNDIAHHNPNFWSSTMLQSLPRGLDGGTGPGDSSSRSMTPTQNHSNFHRPVPPPPAHHHHLPGHAPPHHMLPGSALGFQPDQRMPYYTQQWAASSQDS